MSEGFTPICEQYFDYNNDNTLKTMMENSKSNKKDFLIVKECNHYHQCDAIVIIPLETFFKSYNQIQYNFVQLYLANSKVSLDYFRKIEFHNSTNIKEDWKDVQMDCDDLKKEGYFEYLMYYDPKKKDIEEDGGAKEEI